MATNREILTAIEELANGQGIAGLRNDMQILKEKVDSLTKDVGDIKSAGFHDETSLRNRVKDLEDEVGYLKEKLRVKNAWWNRVGTHALLAIVAFIAVLVAQKVLG